MKKLLLLIAAWCFFAIPSAHSQAIGAVWTSATTGTLNGIPFTVTFPCNPGSASVDNSFTYNDAPFFSAAPLSNVEGVDYRVCENWTITFSQPVSNFALYLRWWRGAYTFTFNSSFTATQGSDLLVSGNSVTGSVPGAWINGILVFDSPITTLTCTVPTGDFSAQLMTFGVINSPIVPTTQLSVSCGATELALNSYIYAGAATGAQDYEFEFSNVSLGYSQTIQRGYATPKMYLASVAGLQIGQTYNVRVKVKAGGVWGDYGPTCTIALANPVITTSLTPAYCNASNLNLSSLIYCNAVAGATDYEFRLTGYNNAYDQTRVKAFGKTYISLTAYNGLVMGQIYNVTVKAKVGGVWSDAGAPCQISLGILGRAANTEELAVVENNNEIISNDATEVVANEDVVFEETKSEKTIETSALNNATANITVYPNPTSKTSVLNIAFNTDEMGKVVITDISGRVIAQQNFNTNLNSVVEINLSETTISKGVYTLSVIGNKTTTQKAIVITE